MLIPAQSPEHASLLAFPPTGRLPSTLSAADLWWVLFEASQVLHSRPTPTPSRQLRLLDFPSRPVIPIVTTGGMRSPRFQRAPFVRDVASDPGRTTVVTSGVNLSQNRRFEFPCDLANACSLDPIEDAAVLGPIKAKPFGWPRNPRPALTGLRATA
jgi:hypothetical protein